MDMNVSAGIAWAVPVRPDDLGSHLEAYLKVAPTLKGLRLCHTFGKGNFAYVTKLPHELLHAIEGYIFQHALLAVSGQWEWPFEHYESRCEPFAGHCEDLYGVLADCKDGFPGQLCKVCQSNDSDDNDSSAKCTSRCDEKVMELMNEQSVSGDTGDWCGEMCDPEHERWEAMIDQSANGNFAKYDKVLQKHFGLKAFFAPTRRAEGSNASWPEDPNHKWHVGHELKTTICYLTLPRKHSVAQMLETSDYEGANASWLIEGIQSSFVELPTVTDRGRRVKQFRNALSSLKLEPHVHPSQLLDTVTAKTACKGEDGTGEIDGDHKASDDNTKTVVKHEWPQLIMLVKSVTASHF